MMKAIVYVIREVMISHVHLILVLVVLKIYVEEL